MAFSLKQLKIAEAPVSPAHRHAAATPLAQQSQNNVNLNLSSGSHNTTAGSLLGDKQANINVGGARVLVNANTPITQAQRMAVMQVLAEVTN